MILIDLKTIKGRRNTVDHDCFGVDAEEIRYILKKRILILSTDIVG